MTAKKNYSSEHFRSRWQIATTLFRDSFQTPGQRKSFPTKKLRDKPLKKTFSSWLSYKKYFYKITEEAQKTNSYCPSIANS